ncbi:complement C1q protein [Bacillus toyonensis]|nr:complement C1q protein [Bacillus toyonensis]
MKKILTLLPILLVAGMFTFSTDNQQADNKQTASKPAVQRMMTDPGGGW